MGKGQRVRASRAAEQEAIKLENAKKAKKRKFWAITSVVVAIALVLGIAGSFVYRGIYSAAYNKGTVQRNTAVMKTDHYTVDAAMMSFFFYTQYNTFVNTYSSYLSYVGLDTSKSLKSQTNTMNQDGGTWFDYFKGEAVSQVKELLYLAEKATAEGVSLDDEDQADIQKTIDNYSAYAEKSSIKSGEFLSKVFGKGVNERDVRKCLELSALAGKYKEQFDDALNYTDADINQYYSDNSKTYQYVDYYSYTITATDTSDNTTYAAAESFANDLAKVKSTAAFKSWVENYVRGKAVLTDDYTQENLQSDVESAVNALETKKSGYTDSDDGSKWLFSDATVGATYVKDGGSGSYTVYFCTATPYRDDQLTRTIRDIVFTTNTYSTKDAAKEKAEAVLEEMKQAGLTEETFKTYATTYSENTATSGNGGLCENYKESAFDSRVASWAYDSARQAGDFEVVELDSGYAICYYVGVGISAWKADCISAMKSRDYETAYNEWTSAYTLTEHAKAYNKIPDIA